MIIVAFMQQVSQQIYTYIVFSVNKDEYCIYPISYDYFYHNAIWYTIDMQKFIVWSKNCLVYHTRLKTKRDFTVLRECKPPPRCLSSVKSDPGFKSGVEDLFAFGSRCLPDCCHVVFSNFHYLVGINYFTQCHENQLVIVTVWEMAINLLNQD